MGDEGDDRADVAEALAGDREAFGRLVARYQEVVFRAAWLIVRDAGEAEDLAQDAFLRAHAALGSFRPGDPLRPWLLRIATNLALNAVRARGRRQGLLARFGRLRENTPPEPPDVAEATEEQRTLWLAMNELREEDRVVLYLRHYLELPEREIAATLRCPQGTVKSRLHRASGRLKAIIEARYPSLAPEGGRRD